MELYPARLARPTLPPPALQLAPWALGEPQPLSGLAQLAPITLAQMDAVALLDRTDTKYLLRAADLPELLAALAPAYRVLEIAGARLSAYETIYFDTPDFALYRRHHAGRRQRCKVRGRRYVATNRCFFEVKVKAGPGRTHKERVETRELASTVSPALAARLAEWQVALPANALRPAVTNDFVRITLVGQRQPERVTLDLDLRFGAGGRTAALPGLLVAEVKVAGRPHASACVQLMRARHIQPAGFSKYCIGAALLYPELPRNHFKPVLHQVSRLLKGTPYVH